MRKIVLGLVAAVTAISLTACGAVTEGEVTDKIFTEAYTTQEEIMEEECEWDTDTYYSGGKRKTKKSYECESVGTGEFEDVEHPAQYEFELTNSDGDTGIVEVTEDVFNSTNEGEFYASE